MSVGRLCYQCETALEALALNQDPQGGSTSSKWWTQSQPIRTLAEMPINFALIETRRPFAYQAIAEKALTLYRLGMSATTIGRTLGVSDKTVTKAINLVRCGASQLGQVRPE